MKELVKKMPGYDFVYLGDNARAPYGTRSFDTVYEYTLQCVKWLFAQECQLVILACNTASAKALRNIQQKDMAFIDRQKRVLGIIRPTAEVIGNFTKTNHVGILGTTGTIQSDSYLMEIKKSFPDIHVFQQACTEWVTMIESNAFNSPTAEQEIKKDLYALLKQSNSIDTILLACTHYPLLLKKIKKFTPAHINIISQGAIIADSLIDYLNRHPEIESRCAKGSSMDFYTTGSATDFDTHSSAFFGKPVMSTQIIL